VNHLGDLLSALIDGELTGADLDRANAHLATCTDCRTEAAELRQLKRALRALAETAGADLYGGAALSERLLALDAPGRAGRRPGGNRRPDYLARARLRGGARRRPARRRNRFIWGAVSLMVVGIGAAAFAVGGGGSAPSEQQITPQFEVFDMHNAITTGEVPLTGAARVTEETPAPAETPTP
jgi:anti-sigma factor RsiW